MGWCVGSWLGQWVGSGQINNNLINLDIIKISSVEDNDLWRYPHPCGCMGSWVDGWFNGSMGGVRSYS